MHTKGGESIYEIHKGDGVVAKCDNKEVAESRTRGIFIIMGYGIFYVIQ